MKELRDIINAFDRAQKQGQKTALATVVLVEGSSYRRAGARMLITETGQLTGAISGGCLEGDALRKARMAILQQKPMLVTYDTTDEDDAKLGIQLGCNGIIHILIEPIDPAQTINPILIFQRFFSERQSAVIVTLFNLAERHQQQYGTCLFINKRGQIINTLLDVTGDDLVNEATDILKRGDGYSRTYISRGNYTCFIELLQPTTKLVVVGAGNDAIPLIQIAKVLGWDVTVVDGRPNYNTVERFPLADRLIIAKPDEVVAQINADNRTVLMLMTHNFNYDSALLKQLLPLDLPYIGILGPKKRLIRLFDEIPGAGSESSYTHIHGPAGLDIGSETPEQIALSIIAEIQGVLNNLSGLPLKKKMFIHDRANEHIIHAD